MKHKFLTCTVVFWCTLCFLFATFLPPCYSKEPAPDLVISGYGKSVEDNPWLHQRDVVAPGDRVVYRITVTNQGNATYNGSVHAYATNIPNGWQTLDSIAKVTLPPYGQGQASHNINVSIVIPDNAKPGQYDVNFHIGHVQGERKTHNNTHKVSVNILPPQPDLSIVDIRWMPADFSVFDRPDINVIMRNQGTSDSGAFKLELDVQIGSERYTSHLEAEIPGIKQGDRRTWKSGRILGTGMFSTKYNKNVIKATINADHRIAEHNYLNNERIKYIPVREGVLHADLDWQPHNPTTQDEVDFLFTVTNKGDVRWTFPDHKMDGQGSTIILRYWPSGNFDDAKVIEDSMWVLGAGESRTLHFHERFLEPGEYRVKCEIFAGFPYWTVTQTPEMTFSVSAP
ncbi:MAG: CARDB domain-containing protein [Candidatus Brocadiales bacterium]